MIQTDILSLLEKHANLSLTDIARDIDASNTPIVLYHLRRMVAQGKIRRNEDKTYSFVDVDGLDVVPITYIGHAKAGADDRFIDENGITSFPVQTTKIRHNPSDLILVSVDGDSMETTFHDKDLLMFKKYAIGEYPKDDEIILARFNDGVKIKRFHLYRDHAGNLNGQLVSDNDKYAIIPVDDDNFTPIAKFVRNMNE